VGKQARHAGIKKPLPSPEQRLNEQSTIGSLTMHYYQFNIADYRKRTGHLTLVEHAIYRSLMDTYYLQEGPLEGDLNRLMRSHSVRSKVEKQAFSDVLEEFFILAQNKYFHATCDSVLANIYEKSEKARASAKKRWDKKDAKPMRMNAYKVEITKTLVKRALLPILQPGGAK